jgi:hypothetical protein
MVFYSDGGAQKFVRNHLDFVVVNLPTFDAHSGIGRNVLDLDIRLAELTNFFTVFSFNVTISEIAFAQSLDAAMAAGTKDFCLIQNCGHIFYGYDQLSFDMKAAMEDCEFLTGHIMDRGNYFYMHDQCLLVNRRAWEKLGKPAFGGLETGVKRLPLPYRSIENIHDNYTPLYLQPLGRDRDFDAIFGYGWNAIAAGLTGGHRITNWPNAVRKWKRHCYAYYGDAQAWIAALADVTKAEKGPDDQLNQTVDFLRNTPDKVDAPHKVFVFNSESDADIPILKYRDGLDRAFVLASGFKANRMLESFGFGPQTEVITYDYSTPALALRRLMIEEWDGRDYGAFFLAAKPRIDALFAGAAAYLPPHLLKDAATIDKEFKRELGEVFTSTDHWLDHWRRFKALTHHFVEVDVLQDEAGVRAMIDAHAKGNTALWLSDMFNSPNAVGKFGWDRRKAAYDTVVNRLKAATDSYLILGKDPRVWIRPG